MKELKEQIKKGKIQGPYLFYGEETFLIRTYIDRIRRALMQEVDELMNYSVLNNPRTAEEIRDALETLPFMVEKRLVVIRNSEAFQPGADFSLLEESLAETKETAVVIFTEEKVDKRARLYKQMMKIGKIVEFVQQTPADLAKWVRKEAERKGKQIDEETASFFVSYVGRDMTHILEEWDKVAALTADKGKVTREDIQAICTVNVEENIFSLTDQIANKKAAAAMKIFSDLLTRNTPPQKIFYMIIRQFRQLLRAAVLSDEGKNGYDVAKVLGIPSYPAEICIRQGKKFGSKRMEEILRELLEMDTAAKNGNLEATDACMLIIMKYAA